MRVPLQLSTITRTSVILTHTSLYPFAYEYFFTAFLCAQHYVLIIPWVKVYHVSHKRASFSYRGTTPFQALTDDRDTVQPPSTAPKHSNFLQPVQQQHSSTERSHSPTPYLSVRANIIVSSKCKLNDFFRSASRSYNLPAINHFFNIFLEISCEYPHILRNNR